MNDIRLIATDLDGTIIARADDFHLYPAFREKVEDLRARCGVILAICTGRSLRSFHRFFTPMRMMGITPDFIIVKHAYIYSCGRFVYVPHVLWNLRTRYAIWFNRILAGRAISRWHRTIREQIPRTRTLHKTRNRLQVRFDSREAAAMAASLLRDKALKLKRFQIFEYKQEIEVCPVPFMKGLAVSELRKHLKLSRDQVITIGNGHNDISMLDPGVAVMSGCPSNSEPEVIEKINEIGGHIASKPSLGGAMETIMAYCNGTIRSELPDGWIGRTGQEGSSRKKRHHERESNNLAVSGWLCVLGFYAVLVVFANYGMLPLSGIILKPFYIAVEIIKKLVSCL